MSLRYFSCLVVLCCAIAAVPVSCWAESAALPVYPGSEVELELNLTQNDFLPVIKQWIGLAPAMLAGALSQGTVNGPDRSGDSGDGAAVNPLAGLMTEEMVKEIQEVMAGLEQVSVIAYKHPKGATPDRIADMYMQKLGLSKGWQQTLRVSQKEAAVRLYVKPDLSAMFGTVVSDGRVAALRTDGKVDFAKLGALAAKYLPAVMSLKSGTENSVPDEPVDEQGGLNGESSK